VQTPSANVSARLGFHTGFSGLLTELLDVGPGEGSGSGSGSGGSCGGSGRGFPSSTCVLCSVMALSSLMRLRGGRRCIPCGLGFRARRARPDHHGARTVSQPRGGMSTGACMLRPGPGRQEPDRWWAQIRDDFLANELRQRPTLTVTYAVRCNMSCPADTRNSGTSTPPLQQSFEGGSTLAYETR
jgi:hypothetical protein